MNTGTAPTNHSSLTSNSPRKSHGRRESSGHLCTACDQCYRCKVKCSGERPNCQRCSQNGSACTYSTGKPLGKPKGSKNKRQRTKTSPELGGRQTMVQDCRPPSNAITLSSPAKRSSDGSLPAPKKTLSASSIVHGTTSQPAPRFLSPMIDTPEMPSLPVASRHEDTPLVSEPLPYYVDTANHDSALQQVMEQSTPGKLDDVFPSAGLNLDMDDFQWFSSSPDLSTEQEPISGISSAHQSSPSSLLAQAQKNPALDCTFAPPVYGEVPHGLPCLCDPLSLGIISDLHTLQVSFSPLDTALLLARRGLTTVSSYLSCPSCLNHLSNSPSLFLACVLILQQVFACYITLRVQGSKLFNKPDSQGSPRCSSVSIGEFEVEGEESCNVLLDAIVKAEMERGKGVIGGLEQWVERVGDGKEKMAGLLLQSLREEIGGAR